MDIGPGRKATTLESRFTELDTPILLSGIQALVRVLLDQELEPSSRFIEKVRKRIYRRATASHFASYSWHLPKMILMEMVSLMGHLAKAFGTNKES